ncbi:hypothetical protein [Actinoplanes aureus]|jgi:hypothetical protein|uniref:Uncharacterized protein n=1 Tax=Actinoplanes aureus TaxID=2792083 RepID=A0A931CEF7_9ACTN|nr:hypothetical protein [Actinoplanes aureus]MBG0568385.1 hypothetical protein [Actinoplanes aureus]
MTANQPKEPPDYERPIDLTDTPDGKSRPAPIPEHHPDDNDIPGRVTGPDTPPRT